MKWIDLTDENQLESVKELSRSQAVIIFKHSTRCMTSSMARNRLEREAPPSNVAFFFLDLLRHRGLSNRIAEEFGVHHASPQVLLIRNGECIYDDSHNGINMQDIAEQVVLN